MQVEDFVNSVNFLEQFIQRFFSEAIMNIIYELLYGYATQIL